MKKALMWFRRDLRLTDNMALSVATRNCDVVFPVFVFDENILGKLKNKKDRRVTYIFERLLELSKKKKFIIVYGDPVEVIPKLVKELGAEEVYANEDYESYGLARDENVSKKVKLNLFKDQVIFRFDEIKNGKGEPYKVFTPYKNKWLEKLDMTPEAYLERKVITQKIAHAVPKMKTVSKLKDIGFETEPIVFPKNHFNIDKYKQRRDFPALDATSYLSVALRFGVKGIRELIREKMPFKNEDSQTWLSELVWREFYFYILGNFPKVEKGPFIEDYKNVKWLNDKKEYKAWCEGKTGVPIVDAGMRQLNETGFMHNRVRMIVASYLCKTLLIDWRWGEKYFAEKLNDFDLSANNGGWQWCASTGCDAAPYFRIFNPYTQSKKFDENAEYIIKYIPELSAHTPKEIHNPDKFSLSNYPAPIVDYKARRVKALQLYKDAKEN